MATFTTKLNLRKPNPTPVTGDLVDAQADINDNMDKIDVAFGTVVCTSTTRPSSPFVGQQAYETDTSADIICTALGPITWRYLSMPRVSSFAVVPVASIVTNLIVVLTSDQKLYKWNGSAWVPAMPRGVIAEVKRTAADNITGVAVMESTSVQIYNGFKYRLTWNANHASSVSGPPNGTAHIRTAAGGTIATSSTVVRQAGILISPATFQPYTLIGSYTATATETRAFGITAQSNGAPTITFEGTTADRRLFQVEEVA